MNVNENVARETEQFDEDKSPKLNSTCLNSDTNEELKKNSNSNRQISIEETNATNPFDGAFQFHEENILLTMENHQKIFVRKVNRSRLWQQYK